MTQFIPKKPNDDVNVSRETYLSEAFYLVAATALLSGGLIFVLFFFVDVAVRLIPTDAEAMLLDTFVEQFPTASNEAEDELLALTNQLAQHWDDNPYQIRTRILEEEVPNAFAVPGGMILVTQGMLDLTTSKEALAFVLAHELGHFYHRDHLRGLSRGLLLKLLLFTSGLNQSMPLIENSAQLTMLYHSRGQEIAADRFALELLHREFGSVAGGVGFFKQLMAQQKQDLTPEFLRTHPVNQTRLNGIEEYSRNLLR
ncbi:MAG TPA: hypothetical protein DCZ03_04240 [Gammaproteobacteria bacterium]|nr:hypothetical protein [Gammaproteobacteria bacterium]